MKRLYVFFTVIPFLLLGSIQGHAQPKECPVLSELLETSIGDKREVTEALKTLIPKTYGTGLDDYSDMYIFIPADL